MSVVLEQNKHLTSAIVLDIIILTIAAVVQEQFVYEILVSVLSNMLLQLYFYIVTPDIFRECADASGTPPHNQSKIMNLERYLLAKLKTVHSTCII